MKFEDVNQQPPALLEQYDYTYTGLNQAYTRTETAGAVKYTYSFDKLRRLTQEKKQTTAQPPALHYQKDFSYDKAGNRASYQHQNGQGYNYGAAVNYSQFGYDEMGRLSAVQDMGRSYSATITNDWNGNITQVTEVIPGTLSATSTFAYDNENRLTEFSIGGSGWDTKGHSRVDGMGSGAGSWPGQSAGNLYWRGLIVMLAEGFVFSLPARTQISVLRKTTDNVEKEIFCLQLVNRFWRAMRKVCANRRRRFECLPDRVARCVLASCSVSTTVKYTTKCHYRMWTDEGKKGQCVTGKCHYDVCCDNYWNDPSDLKHFEATVLHELMHCCSTMAEGQVAACTKECYPDYESGHLDPEVSCCAKPKQIKCMLV